MLGRKQVSRWGADRLTSKSIPRTTWKTWTSGLSWAKTSTRENTMASTVVTLVPASLSWDGGLALECQDLSEAQNHLTGCHPTQWPNKQKRTPEPCMPLGRYRWWNARPIPWETEVYLSKEPPGSKERTEGPSWDLPEIKKVMGRMNASSVEFNTCSYMSKSKVRFFKPAKWAGKLQDMAALSRVCRCPNWVIHKPVVGAVSVEAGVYRDELCEAVAEKVVATWKRVLSLEFYRDRLETKSQEVSSLQKQWLSNENRRNKRSWEEMTSHSLPETKEPKTKLKAGEVSESVKARSSGFESTKERKEKENKFYVGGMRNPTVAVRRLWKLKDAGLQIRKAWESFIKSHPKAVKLGLDYGTLAAKFDEDIAEAWTLWLEKTLNAKPKDGVRIKDNLQFKSPLNAKLWQAWEEVSGDPEKWIPTWIEEGVPLGMSKEIPVSDVFPPSTNLNAEEEHAPELEFLQGIENYKSFTDNPDDAQAEVDRYLKEGYAILIDKAEAERKFTLGTVSKLALIVKTKPDGSKKRRVVIDLRRSGGNALATCPERLVLPRIQDVTSMARDLARRAETIEDMDPGRKSVPDRSQPAAEWVGFDFKDAFCHFALHEEELRHALAPAQNPSKYILFRAMLFGFRSAPLIMARLSAATARLVQAMMEDWQAQCQLYIDDLLVMVRGTDLDRAKCISLIAYTLRAFGLQLSLTKGERGQQIQWIGGTLLMDWDRGRKPRNLSFGVPKKMVAEIEESLVQWKSKGMIPLRDLRSLAGKLSWVAGVIPRIRWTVAIFYAVLSTAEREEQEGIEAARAAKREDKREKKGLVAVKRLGIARAWLERLFKKPDTLLIKIEPLQEPIPEFVLITDACPLGLGGILCKIKHEAQELEILEAYEAPFHTEEAEMLCVKKGSSSAQATVEAFAIWKALKLWAARLESKTIVIRSLICSLGDGWKAHVFQLVAELPRKRDGYDARVPPRPQTDPPAPSGKTEHGGRLAVAVGGSHKRTAPCAERSQSATSWTNQRGRFLPSSTWGQGKPLVNSAANCSIFVPPPVKACGR